MSGDLMYNMIVNLTQQVIDLKAENDELKRKNSRLIKIEEHQYEINTLEGELENAYAEHDALYQALMNCQINVNVQRAELTRYENTVANLRNDLRQLLKSKDRDSVFNPSKFIDRESGFCEPLKTSTPKVNRTGQMKFQNKKLRNLAKNRIDSIMDEIKKQHSKLAKEISTMDVEFWTYQSTDSGSSLFTLDSPENDDKTFNDRDSTFQSTFTSTTPKKKKNFPRL